jgi:hypothetical protein
VGNPERFATLAPGGGTALECDGTDDLVRIQGFGNRMPTSEVTVEFWQRVHSVKPQSTFCLSPDAVANRFNAHVPWSSGVVYWDFGNINNGGRLAYTPSDSIVGTWQHFALVSSVSGNYMSIYRNGVLEASKSGASTFSRGQNDLSLGWTPVDSGFFDGELDEFRIWNRARTTEEISRDWNVRLAGTETGLVAYYRMDEGAGLTLLDASTNANHGLLVNGPLHVPSAAPISLPHAVTQEPTILTPASAALNGLVKPGVSTTYAWFQWDTTISYGSATAITSIGSGATDVPVSAVLAGLTPNVTYHYRVVGSNSLGVSYGANRSFLIWPVSNLADSGAGSLREAIASAGSGATLVLTNAGTLTLTSAELAINKHLSIVGPGATGLAISGNSARRVFNIGSGYTVNLSGLTIRDGKSADGAAGSPGQPGQPGGGIYNGGVLTLNDCVVTNNRAGNGGNGQGTGAAGGIGGSGGGIFNNGTGLLTLNRCNVTSNYTGTGGQGGQGSKGGTGSTGGAGGDGGNGGAGGGIYSDGILELNECLLSGNWTGSGGTGGGGGEGGLDAWDGENGGKGGKGGRGGFGGAIYGNGQVTLTTCTVSGNAVGSGANGGTGGPGTSGSVGSGSNGDRGAGGDGGSGGAVGNTGSLKLFGCTVVYNSSGAAGAAGAWPGSGGAAGATGRGGGITNQASAQAQLVNTIVALNTITGVTPDDVKGAFASLGHNLLGTTTGSTGFGATDLLNLHPVLGPLGNNGGPTRTHTLLPGSPAINAGNNDYASATDQRGLPRIANGTVDIGAVEFQYWPVATTLPASNVSATGAIARATLQGTVNPSGPMSTTAWFEWYDGSARRQTTPHRGG